jgi:hypothetical protein
MGGPGPSRQRSRLRSRPARHPNMAHTRQSSSDSGLRFQVRVLEAS